MENLASISSTGMHAIKRLTVNSDTLRQYLILTGHIFDIPPIIRRHVTFKLRCSTFGQRILPFTTSRPAFPLDGAYSVLSLLISVKRQT